VVSAPSRRELVRYLTDQGLSERRSLKVAGMSASALRYRPAPDRNATLKEQIIALAQRHRRYGAGMIYLKLRQAGEIVNHKRVDRLYAEAGLQVKRRKRKKIPAAYRHPLERPLMANQMWSMDFVFDRTAEGGAIKNLTIVDDATHEAVAIISERALSGQHLTRILDELAKTRGLPKAIRPIMEKNSAGGACCLGRMRAPFNCFSLNPANRIGMPTSNRLMDASATSA
jgi:transposase InsO family protein